MAKVKKVKAQIKVQVTGGQATPAPPVGTALGPHGVNIAMFVKEFNDRTKEMMGTTIPVIITVYDDRSFEFILKSPPAAVMLKKAAKIASGAANPRTQKVGKVTRSQVEDIVKVKFSDMNSSTPEQAFKVIAGTARSMGIEIVD
jgi:large subunit ribosomal protein L11